MSEYPTDERFDHTNWHGDGKWNFNGRQDLEQFLSTYDIDQQKICLIGSTILHLSGIRQNKDIDYIIDPEIKPDIREELQKEDQRNDQYGEMKFEKIDRSSLSDKKDHRFEIFGLSDQDILYNDDYHVVVDGIKVLRLEIYFSMLHFSKSKTKHKKDFSDICEMPLGNKNWNWDLVFVPPPWKISKNDSETSSFLTPSEIKRAFQEHNAFYVFRKGPSHIAQRFIKWTQSVMPPISAIRRPFSDGIFGYQIDEKNIKRNQLSKNPDLTAILLPPAKQHFDEVENILSNYGNVESSSNKTIEDGFPEFIHKLYKISEISSTDCREIYDAKTWPPDWHIDKLNHEIETAGKTVRIIHFTLPEPNWVIRARPVSLKAVKLREKLRMRLHTQVSNYTYDNTILISGNEGTASKMSNIIEASVKR